MPATRSLAGDADSYGAHVGHQLQLKFNRWARLGMLRTKRFIFVLTEADMAETMGYVDNMWQELEEYAYLPNQAMQAIRNSLGGRQSRKRLKACPLPYLCPTVHRRNELRQNPHPSGGPLQWWLASDERGRTMWMLQPEYAASCWPCLATPHRPSLHSIRSRLPAPPVGSRLLWNARLETCRTTRALLQRSHC